MIGVLISCGVNAQETVVVSPAPAEIALTIYRDDLALVTEKRRFDLPAGRSKIEFWGVNDRIIAQSALLNEFGAVTIERNFDFDLLTPSAFFAKSVGKTVTLTRTNPKTGRAARVSARIVSASPGSGVLLDAGNGYETYQCSGLPEEISAASLPGALKAKPTLSMEVSADRAGPQEMTISYLASGFSWQADYVLTLKELPSASLLGWLTLTNGTQTGVENADASIVAGNLQVMDETRSDAKAGDYFWARCWPRGTTKRGTNRQPPPPPESKAGYDTRAVMMAPMAAMDADESIVLTGSRIVAQREDIGDYKLYRTPEKTTVAAHQTKQVAFLDKDEVKAKQRYAFKLSTPDELAADEPTPAPVEYSIDNQKGGLLAQPLPAGTIRVFGAHGAQAVFLGEDDIRDLAVGLPVEAMAAQSPDVRMLTRVVKRSEKRLKNDMTRLSYSMEHVVSNASNQPAEIEVSLGNDFNAAFTVAGANMKLDKSEPLPTFRFTVDANSSTTLAYKATWVE